MSLSVNLKKIKNRSQSISEKLSSGIMGEEFVALSKEYAELEPIIEKIEEYQEVEQELEEAKELLEGEVDEETKNFLLEEQYNLEKKLPLLERQVKLSLLPKDMADEKNAIVEIRAGTGGEEAALFGADLYNMYARYAEKQGWRTELLSLSENGVGGYKEASMLVKGRGVFARLKFESGVHRVQRVPATESSGRIHTSAATVAVLPEAEEVDIEVKMSDIRIDTFRASGAGGQHVNKTSSAVRITHFPTGIVVSCQSERSQHKNKEYAFKILRARIYKLIKEKEAEKMAEKEASKKKIEWGSQIRSYVFHPYNLVKDHRTNHETGNTQAVMDGDIDAFIQEYLASERNR